METAPANPLEPQGARIIPFPVSQPRSCFTCAHARFPEDDVAGPVTVCTVYDEVIDSETYAAEDCFTYEYCEEGSQPIDYELVDPEREES